MVIEKKKKSKNQRSPYMLTVRGRQLMTVCEEKVGGAGAGVI